MQFMGRFYYFLLRTKSEFISNARIQIYFLVVDVLVLHLGFYETELKNFLFLLPQLLNVFDNKFIHMCIQIED
jgi:hypothetical protein